MNDDNLKAICEAKLNNALGWVGGLLSKERIMALQYYRGNLFGNEQEGRSKVVSRDVAEAIDGAMPSLMKIFAATDTIVACRPTRPDSELVAQQATDYLNWVFRTQPNAFDLLQTWIKDGLLSKLGIVKSWWDETDEVTVEEYEGLTQNQYHGLLTDPELEEIECTVRPADPPLDNPSATPSIVSPTSAPQTPTPPQGPPLGLLPGGGVNGHALPSIPTQGPPQAGPGALPQTQANFPSQPAPQPPQPPMQAGTQAGLPPAQPDARMVYDCKFKRTTKKGKICIECIPPEEFLTDRRAVSLEDATFCAHRSIRRVSDLLEMGYPRKIVERLSGGTELDYNTEVLNRFRQEDESPQREDTDALDPAMRHIWVADCYLKVDYDGDGIAEWRKVTIAGGGGWEILENERADGHIFSAWTPIKEPHKLFGDSLAEKTMDIQLIKSTVWRQVMDGMYFNLAPQLVVIEGQANMEDVLTRRPGGIIRAKTAGAVIPLPAEDVSQSGMAMLGYLDSVREARTGIRRWSPGLEGSELNPLASTATGVQSVDDASDETLQLLARNFAEQGMKSLFKRLLKLICQHQDKPSTVRLRGQWIDIDPSTWDSQMDMEVMVGLGTGNKDRMAQELQAMMTTIDGPLLQLQGGLSGPFLTPTNIYNKLIKYTEALGFKESDAFYTNPKEAPPAAPKPPDPKLQIEQVKQQGALAQQQAQLKADQQETQTRTQADMQLAVFKNHLDEQRLQMDAALKQRDAEHQRVMQIHGAQMNAAAKMLDAAHKREAHHQKMAQSADKHIREMQKLRMQPTAGAQ